MARTPKQEAFDDFDYAVAFPGTSRTDITFALAHAGAQGLTVAELHEHSNVTDTTIRKTLSRLTEMGLVEETRKLGKRSFRLSRKGLLGFRVWQDERRSAIEAEERRPETTAGLYRWRVSGYASRRAAVERDEVDAALADVGAELARVSPGEVFVELEYEVDAADEQAALAAVEPAGWTMQGMITRAERVGLAQAVPTRAGHELRFAGRDPAAVVAAVEREVSERVAAIKDAGGLPSDWDHLTQARATVCDFLSRVDVPEGGRLPLPDDARLLDAVSLLWATLDDAGVRAIGEAFEVSEQQVRAHYASLSDELGSPPAGMTWDELCERTLARHRTQGRLRP